MQASVSSVHPNEGHGEADAMTAAELQDNPELALVEAWRLEELQRAGYSRPASVELASRHDIDLHRAVDLLRSGCGEELALRILL
jgi:hypothetical protein